MTSDRDLTARDRAETTDHLAQLPPIGFWSYARQDDQLSSGKLSQLRALLVQELQQQYGRESIQLFQDRSTIPHGSDWEKEIKKALDASTFFIPIITPNFVQSEWCSREVELFIEREKALIATYPELAETSRIFPILLIGIEDAEPVSPTMVAWLAKLQWFDFRRFRHRSYDDSEVREALSELAGTMRRILKRKVRPAAPEVGHETVRIAPEPAAVVEEVPASAADPAPARAAARPIGVGDVLNHMFEVKRFIKAGGMGQVFEGSNIVTGERVAIKALLPALAEDPKVTALFQREAMTLTRLNHEALVQYRVLAKEPELGSLYIVTEYIDGTDLGETLGKIDRSPDELARLLARLAAGLGAAHKLGAIHRDISPDNVMLPGGDPHQAKIIDFGIAKDLGGNLPTLIGDGFAGKLSYVAPEQLGEHGGEIGPWTDVYSLGLVMLSVAKGEKADMAGSLADAIRKRRLPPDLSAVPDNLRPLLADMLRADPAERIRTMAEVGKRLEAPPRRAAIPEPPPRAEPPPVAQAVLASEESERPNRTLLWAGGGGLAVAALFGFFYLSRPSPAPPVAHPPTPSEPKAEATTQAPATAAAEPDRSWLFGRWCVINHETGQQAVWTIREIGNGNILASYPGGRQTETIQRVQAGSIVTDQATYSLDPSGDAVTVRDGTSVTLLERCR